jgi:REP element-mobilizing transposase RayT
MRTRRGESSTGYYHIMNRGINGLYLFNDKFEKEKLLNIMVEEKENIELKIVAYCIMDNHFHFLIKAEKENLMMYMKKIGIRYAMYYNRKEKRRGSVFQDRFKSEVIEDEEYLLSAIRYIHNNPVKANMVEDFTKYNWSSANQYIRRFLKIENNRCKENDFDNHNIKEIGVDIEVFKWVEERYGNKEEFIKNHLEEDFYVHLDISEDMEKERLDKAQNIICRVFEEKGLEEMPSGSEGKEIKKEVCLELIKNTKLSAREIGELLNMSQKQVGKEKTRIKKETLE